MPPFDVPPRASCALHRDLAVPACHAHRVRLPARCGSAARCAPPSYRRDGVRPVVVHPLHAQPQPTPSSGPKSLLRLASTEHRRVRCRWPSARVRAVAAGHAGPAPRRPAERRAARHGPVGEWRTCARGGASTRTHCDQALLGSGAERPDPRVAAGQTERHQRGRDQCERRRDQPPTAAGQRRTSGGTLRWCARRARSAATPRRDLGHGCSDATPVRAPWRDAARAAVRPGTSRADVPGHPHQRDVEGRTVMVTVRRSARAKACATSPATLSGPTSAPSTALRHPDGELFAGARPHGHTGVQPRSGQSGDRRAPACSPVHLLLCRRTRQPDHPRVPTGCTRPPPTTTAERVQPSAGAALPLSATARRRRSARPGRVAAVRGESHPADRGPVRHAPPGQDEGDAAPVPAGPRHACCVDTCAVPSTVTVVRAPAARTRTVCRAPGSS